MPDNYAKIQSLSKFNFYKSFKTFISEKIILSNATKINLLSINISLTICSLINLCWIKIQCRLSSYKSFF